jgi:hypothetical protein
MKADEIEIGQLYAVDDNALYRAAQASDLPPQQRWYFPKVTKGVRDFSGMTYSPGRVLATGQPCGKLTDGVKLLVSHGTWNEARAAVLTVHIAAVLKPWVEHELTEDISSRDQMLRLADTLEEQAREIREKWGAP